MSPDKSWKAENLQAVVFLQERSSHKVLGAAEAPSFPAAAQAIRILSSSADEADA